MAVALVYGSDEHAAARDDRGAADGALLEARRADLAREVAAVERCVAPAWGSGKSRALSCTQRAQASNRRGLYRIRK